MNLISLACQPAMPEAGQPFAIEVEFALDAPISFLPDVGLELFPGELAQACWAGNLQAQRHTPWLPRGRYRARWVCGGSAHPLRARISLHQRAAMAERCMAADELRIPVPECGGEQAAGPAITGHWQLSAIDGTPALETLGWKRGPSDWFFRHFDHAAGTVIEYMLGNSPLLRGRVLDVGCGDGVTALGIALRCRPQALIGIDPFRGFDRLPEILAGAGLEASIIPECLSFLDADANAMPYADDHFDVVVSWGSLEHIAGGHQRALAEIRRVLRPGGLLFVHPGLYYGNYGHHLGEFCDEPHFHLKWPRERIREHVLSTSPDYIDRAGEFSTPAQYWQWFEELNPITVAGFERELRALDFEPWRVAIRTEDRIEYTPELQAHSMQDLATLELYVSAYNRKPAA
ncbi:MAG: class I SAM-dependent methyltransferase [Xanthomonadaceae bacterium]|nr:class I SAM-dependent methyltransferase [Xanthomonadaceae bacterium]